MYTTVHLSQDSSKLSPYISNTLISEIENTLNKWEKTLLYLNKRGSFSSLVCEDCQHLFECPKCDISLSVHSHPHHLLCHLCASRFNMPLACTKCKGTKLKSIGVGTQQIEQALRSYFKKENIYRFDSDSVKNISSKQEALTHLENADIIIGTKMITTWFDFEKVGCIGILLVEQELSFASFDAEEKAYANLKQLIGRGNRKTQETQIVLQTFIPKNPTIVRLLNYNYKDFFFETLSERKEFLYPPFSEMVTLEYRHKENDKSLAYIQKLEQKLQTLNTENTYTILASSNSFKKNNSYHTKCIIKGPEMRNMLTHIESLILQERNLSLIFN